MRRVPIVLTSQSPWKDRIALREIGRGFVLVQIDGASHKLTFSLPSAPSTPLQVQQTDSDSVDQHRRRQAERSRLLHGA